MLVIGAGITGAMVADALRDSGLKVAVVDRRGPAKGSTTASTALVQYEIDTPLIQLARKIGKRDAERAWRRSRLAVDAIAARLRELDVPDVATRDSLYLAGDMLDRDASACASTRRGAPQASRARFLDRKQLRERFGIVARRRPARLRQSRDRSAQGDIGAAATPPLRPNTQNLLPGRHRRRRCQREPRVVATAANGRRIRCRHLVFATGYELPEVRSEHGTQDHLDLGDRHRAAAAAVCGRSSA